MKNNTHNCFLPIDYILRFSINNIYANVSCTVKILKSMDYVMNHLSYKRIFFCLIKIKQNQNNQKVAKFTGKKERMKNQFSDFSDF